MAFIGMKSIVLLVAVCLVLEECEGVKETLTTHNYRESTEMSKTCMVS